MTDTSPSLLNSTAIPPIVGPASWWKFWSGGVLAADEAWVVQKLNTVASGVAVAKADLNAVLTWTFNNFDVIAQDTAQVIAVANSVGLGTNPTVAAAELAANAILAAIAVAKAKSASGDTTALAATAQTAYQAVKDLQIAHAQAAVAVATKA